MIIHNKEVVQKGAELKDAKKLVVMLHDKNNTAQEFIELSRHLSIDLDTFGIVALQAIQNFWYPHATLEPRTENQPQLKNSIEAIDELLHNLGELEFSPEDIYFLGQGQGASLALEYCAQNAVKYGGIIAFGGSLIGADIEMDRYHGDFKGTPILMAAVDNDSVLEQLRFDKTEKVLESLGATVTQKMYPESGHTLREDEMVMAELILS